jgi:hypothetical protein
MHLPVVKSLIPGNSIVAQELPDYIRIGEYADVQAGVYGGCLNEVMRLIALLYQRGDSCFTIFAFLNLMKALQKTVDNPTNIE